MIARARRLYHPAESFQDETDANAYTQQEPLDARECIQSCLGFSSVDIVDSHSRRGACCRGRFDQRPLVSAGADMTIADPIDLLVRGLKQLVTTINNDAMVAKAMHFQEPTGTRNNEVITLYRFIPGKPTPNPSSMGM
ncbi:hypothetical protein [Microvirga sp. 17 mud 1-3]|uniref:hypothetical protein n=1 Tax=Microvirga sp. 17 mud 1-3 TaxID=2082949 RepID=UPI0013A5BC43|nr:hypothetical protein [Microvirga sp. 17 mud 1-3]